MTVHRTIRPRAWSTAAAAAFVAGLATTGVAFAPAAPAEPAVAPPSKPPRSARSASPSALASMAGITPMSSGTPDVEVIALRPDPANPNLLVVDFTVGRSAPVARRVPVDRLTPQGPAPASCEVADQLPVRGPGASEQPPARPVAAAVMAVDVDLDGDG